jgi:hypothetical protein
MRQSGGKSSDSPCLTCSALPMHMLGLARLLLLLPTAAVASRADESPPKYTLLPDYNQALNVLVPHGVSKGKTVSYLGTFARTAECAAACIKHPERCWSFVHMNDAGPVKKTSSWELFAGANNVFGRLSSPTVSSGTLHHLGKYATLAECQRAVNTSEAAFMSYTYHHLLAPVGNFAGHCYGDTSTTWIAPEHQEPGIDSGTAPGFPLSGGGSDPALAGQCFAVTSPGFNPSYDPHAISGIVEWGCRNDEDCSLNGKCSAATGTCECRPAFKGARCEQLNLLTPTRGAGYRGIDDSRNTSSWGGAVLKGSDGFYHMWAAEMTEHCGSESLRLRGLALLLPCERPAPDQGLPCLRSNRVTDRCVFVSRGVQSARGSKTRA